MTFAIFLLTFVLILAVGAVLREMREVRGALNDLYDQQERNIDKL